MLFLPACRTASQGAMFFDHAEAISKQPPADNSHGAPSAAHADSEVREPGEQPQPGNLLAAFGGNEFNAWAVSHRIDVPVGQNRVKDFPVPCQDER
jgi:hypothetical protein